MPIEPRVLRRCLRLIETENRAWTFAEVLQTPEGESDPEVFDALYDTFCATVGTDACTVTDPDPNGVIWFAAYPQAA